MLVVSPRPPASQHSKWQGWAGRRDPNRHWGTDRAPKDPLGLVGLVVVAGGSRTARYWAVWG